MKPAAVSAILISVLASNTGAAPLVKYQQSDVPGNLLSGIVDAGLGLVGNALCAVRTLVVGRSRLCFINAGKGGGVGAGVTMGTPGADSSSNPNSNSVGEDNSFDFRYITVGDEYVITITPDAKGKNECTQRYSKDGDIQDIVAEAANDCLDQ